jgi:hypothetical protein
MIQVWENHQLSASSQRFWQVMRELKKALASGIARGVYYAH